MLMQSNSDKCPKERKHIYAEINGNKYSVISDNIVAGDFKSVPVKYYTLVDVKSDYPLNKYVKYYNLENKPKYVMSIAEETNRDLNVTYIYRRNKNTIRIEYIDKETNKKLLPDVDKEVEQGSMMDFSELTSASVDDYSISSIDGDTTLLIQSDRKITVYYTRNKEKPAITKPTSPTSSPKTQTVSKSLPVKNTIDTGDSINYIVIIGIIFVVMLILVLVSINIKKKTRRRTSMSIYKKVKERASIHKMLSFYGIEKDNITNRYLCPFHKDNDFSLSVTPDDKHWQCMTCEAGGNVITLVEHMERLRGTRLGISDNYMERCNLIIDTQNLDIEKYYISPSMNENLLITNNRQYNQNNLWHSSQKDNNPIFVNGTELQLIYYYSSNIFCIEPCYNTYIAYKNINNLVRDKSAVYDTADSKFWLNLTREYLKETPATSVDVYLKTNSYALSIKFVVSNLISINIGSLCNMIKQEYGVNCLGVVNKEKELKYSVITLLIANKKLLPKPIVEKPLLSKITKRFGIDGKQNASKDECIYSIEMSFTKVVLKEYNHLKNTVLKSKLTV